MPRNATTLYIGDTSIRLMVTRGKRITKLADVPLDISLSDIDTDEKETELVEKIKLLFKSNRIRTKKIILGISGLQCLTRPITLPELPRTMLDEAIIREARRVLPVAPEQLYISWQIISASEGKIQAFMVAIPRQIADTLLRMLNQAGYKPYLMDIKPLALARLSKEATAVIVDVQPSEFDIVIMVNGIPQPIRTVPFTQESQSLKERMTTVTDELKRTVQFYNSNNPDNLLQTNDVMYVSGELIEEPELYEPVANELRFKVAPLSSPLKCAKHLDPSHHLANVGLALKVVMKEGRSLLPNFNTLPVPYQPKQVSLNRVIAIPTAAVAIGSIILLGMTIQNATANINETQLKVDSNIILLEKKQAQKQDLMQNVASLEQQIAALQANRKGYTAALNSFKDAGDLIDGDLEAVVYNVVNDLSLSNLGRWTKQLNLSGKALSEVEILDYVRKLDATGRFSEITITNISRTTEGEDELPIMNFNLSLSLEQESK
jgi:type IV pilus assembly protein PilM